MHLQHASPSHASHIVPDGAFHEKDILLSLFASKPAWGLGIITGI
ncbi:hypothetical protein [Terrimonas pollutisoli]|nr:hypothetical protein [Terrimonas sp. H1YJ31]